MSVQAPLPRIICKMRFVSTVMNLMRSCFIDRNVAEAKSEETSKPEVKAEGSVGTK